MNSTFMFGEDRFGPDENYAATYHHLGGTLPAQTVHTAINACLEYLDERYPDPVYHDAFPTVAETFRHLDATRHLPAEEQALLALTFAVHERGYISETYASALHQLAQTHQLALVADIWAEKTLWLEELNRAGVLNLFDALVFSSDIGSVKPSPRPFLLAGETLNAAPGDCLVIGDSVRRDIGGAARAGIAALWIGEGEPPASAIGSVPSLLDLLP